jgi:F-type H+-transporting ATPase subunit b
VSSLATLFLTTDEDGLISERIFGLDAQFLADACILALAVFVLFVLLSYLVFNPARDLLRRRQEKIQNNLDSAEKEKKDAEALKREYNGKLANAEKESEEILSESRKKALKKEAEIVDEAREEAARILKRAEREAELEKNKVRDDVKTEMIQVAAAMAGKFVTASLDETKQDQLIAETLQEMGDTTWNTDNVEQETI